MFVGSCDTDETASPQAEQKCADATTLTPHLGQAINLSGFYRSESEGRPCLDRPLTIIPCLSSPGSLALRARDDRYAVAVRRLCGHFLADFPSISVVQLFPSSDISHLNVCVVGVGLVTV